MGIGMEDRRACAPRPLHRSVAVFSVLLPPDSPINSYPLLTRVPCDTLADKFRFCLFFGFFGTPFEPSALVYPHPHLPSPVYRAVALTNSRTAGPCYVRRAKSLIGINEPRNFSRFLLAGTTAIPLQTPTPWHADGFGCRLRALSGHRPRPPLRCRLLCW